MGLPMQQKLHIKKMIDDNIVFMVLNQKQQHLWKIQTTRAESFHVKWTKAGHDPTQIWMKLFQMKSIYEIRLSWKFQHKLRICSKVMAPQSCHGQLKIDKTIGV